MKKKLIIILLMGCLFLTSVVSVLTAGAMRTDKVTSGSLFKYDENVRSESNYVIPVGTGDIVDSRSGLKIKSSSLGGFETSSLMAGDFSLDFKVFANTTGINDIDLLTFTFKDYDSGESFKVYYDMTKDQSFEEKGIGKAFVTFPNGYSKYGAYEGDNLLDYQWGGVYVASFNNLKSEGRDERVAEQGIKFLPSEKQVLVTDIQGNEALLVDLDDPKSCERANTIPVSGFEKYSVRVDFSSVRSHVNEKHPSSMVLYSLNGQDLSGSKLNNTSAPSVSVRFDVQAVEGYKYLLPTPIQYDVLDGFTSFNGKMKVLSDGKEIPIENGYIIDPKFGKYSLVLYGMTDSDGLLAEEKTFEFSVRLKHPGHEIMIFENLPDYAVGVGSEIYLPSFSSESKVGLNGVVSTSCKIVVEHQGKVVYEKDDVSEPSFYSANKTGVYLVKLISEDVIGHIAEKSFKVTVDDVAPIFNVGAFNGVYKLGTSFVAPKTTVTVNGVSVVPVCRLYSPFGKETDTLDVAGDYTYKVSYNLNGKEYFVQRGFRVLRGAEQLFENLRGSSFEADVNSPEFLSSYNGVKVSATRSNSTVKYVHPIDITKLTGDIPLIEFLPLPREQGIADFGMVTITLTDVNNPMSSIGVKICRSYDRGYYWMSMVRAGINNDNYAGWAWGALKTDEGRGTDMTVSFLGNPYDKDMKASSGKIYFDYNTKAFYCSYFEDKLLILDLDSTSDVGLGNEWMGFSSDFAYLTVTANSLENRTGDYMLISVAGQKLGGTYPESVTPVEIGVDMFGNNEPPKGKINIPYPILNARAYDGVNKNIPYNTNVYVNYGSSSQKEIPVRKDGSFVPAKEGIYTIVYSAGKIKKRVNVTVGKVEPLSFVLEDEYLNSSYAGQEIKVPDGKISGGSGNKIIEYKATYSNGEDIPITGGIFKPTREDNIRVTVKIKDYLGEFIEKNYDIKINLSDKPILDFNPSVSSAYIVGKNYTLPKITGIDYSNTNGTAESEMFLHTNSGLTPLKDGKWTPDASLVGKQDVKIIYRLYKVGNKDIYEEYSYPVNVIEPKGKKDYFVGFSGAEKSDTKDGMHFSVSKEGAGVQFINPVVTEFKLSFSIKTAMVGGFIIGLTDSENANIRTEIMLKQEGPRCYTYINGVKSGVMAGTFGGDMFKLQLQGKNLYNGKDNICGTFTQLVNGKPFVEFPSKKVYIDMSFIGVSGNAIASIMEINGQLFDDTDKDYMRPEIFLEKEIERNASINETIIIPAAHAYDVLDPFTEITVTVKGPKGWVVFNKQPIDKELSFKAERYGQYTITYTAVDSRKNVARFPASITVMDNIPPVLDIKGEIKDMARVGEKFVLPEITATDNTDGDVKVYINYIDPLGRMIRVEDGEFIPEMTGEYKILIFAKDAAYSYVRKEFTLRVGR